MKHSLAGHRDSVLSCAWYPNGSTIVSVSADKTICLWDPSQGGQVPRASSFSLHFLH